MSNDPVLIAWSAKRSKRTGRTSWIRIGRAWPHARGAGLTVLLDLVPLDGRIVLLELNEEDDRRLLAEAKEFADDMKVKAASASKSKSPSNGKKR